MTHRANQIVDAAVAAIRNQVQAAGTKVFAMRTLSLADDQDELPAIVVDFGSDEPIGENGASNLAFFDSLLTLEITGATTADDEPELKAALLELRRQAHIAMRAAPQFGLAFVVDTLPGPTDAPEVEAGGDRLAGALSSAWQIYYRMNLNDPGG